MSGFCFNMKIAIALLVKTCRAMTICGIIRANRKIL